MDHGSRYKKIQKSVKSSVVLDERELWMTVTAGKD
jgi:hypothetical protein